MRIAKRQTAITGSAALALATLALSVHELSSPGFCPNYPLLNLPACYVMTVYFGLLFGSFFLPHRKQAARLFHLAWAVSFASSIYFSARELVDIENCPRLFDIPLPLCFLVPPALVLLLWLKRTVQNN